MLDWKEILIRLLVAALLGSLVGIERQRYSEGAGLRTHMLVCLGSALIMIVSAYGFQEVLGESHIVLDPSRIAAQVVSGIGFLGAGTILFLRQDVVKGLTTAAGLWTVAGVGLATGGGLFFAASITTVLALIILVAIKPYKERLVSKKHANGIYLKLDKEKITIAALDEIINNEQLNYRNLKINKDKNEVCAVEIIFDKSTQKSAIVELIKKISNLDGIYQAEIKSLV